MININYTITKMSSFNNNIYGINNETNQCFELTVNCMTINYTVTKYILIMLLLLIYSFCVTIRLFRD
jgi:hypothetical protein